MNDNEEVQFLMLSISVLFKRYNGLSEEDRKDLHQLLVLLSKEDDADEQREICDTLVEFLMQHVPCR